MRQPWLAICESCSLFLELEMEWLNADTGLFYSLVWSMGFIPATVVLLGDPRRKSIGQCILGGSLTGFLAFAFVAVLVGWVDGVITNHFKYVGMATIIGLNAKKSEKLREVMYDFVIGVFSKYKITIIPGREKEDHREDS